MDVSDADLGGTITVATRATARQLTPTISQHSIELRDFCLDLSLSRATLDRMNEVDLRTTRVFRTATRFAFR